MLYSVYSVVLSLGSNVNRFLIRLMLVILKIGEFGFLLMVMIVLVFLMLVRCWMVLLMFMVMYSFGEMILLVWLICRLLGI